MRKIWKSKKNAIRKIYLVLCLLAAMALAPAAAVFADPGVPDLDMTEGSIQISPKVAGENNVIVTGTEFTLYQVGRVEAIDTGLIYTLTDELSASAIDISDLSKTGVPEELLKYIQQNQIQGTTAKADGQGTVRFTDLPLGLYLMVQTNEIEGYQKADAFLVSIPMLSTDGESFIYQVDASPKMEIVRETVPETEKPETPKGPRLPQTGQTNWPVPVMAALGILCFGLGWWLFVSARREDA